MTSTGSTVDAAAAEALGLPSALAFIAVAAVGLLSAGLLAGLETGSYSLSRVRLSIRAARGDAGARALSAEFARPSRLLTTLLVANALAGWAASFGTSQIFDGLGYGAVEAVLLDLAVLVPVVFLVGEVLPKDLFRQHADRWMPAFGPALRWLRVVLAASGLVPLVAWIGALVARLLGARGGEEALESRARVSAMLAEGAGQEGLSEAQLGFADRVLTMREVVVGGEMRHWRDVAWIPEAAPPDERVRAFSVSGASRLPVLDPGGRVLGAVYAIDHLEQPKAPTDALVRPVLVIPPTTPALEAIQTMRRGRIRLAVVAERPDRPLGIVTMKDLVEPLVGDLAAW